MGCRVARSIHQQFRYLVKDKEFLVALELRIRCDRAK